MNRLSHNDLELIIDPALGGAVMAFSLSGIPILRDSCAGRTPVETAGFPMIPFAGRIEDAAFPFGGANVTLEKNFPPEPHAIHGETWLKPWDTLRETQVELHLAFTSDGRNWPWVYRAEQVFTLLSDGLRLALSITNTSDRPMPAGVGWHPYFDAEGARLDVSPGAVWNTVPGCTRGAPPIDLGHGPQAVQALTYDHAFDWPDRRLSIAWPDRGMRAALTASDIFNHLILYTPAGEPHFCAEPVSHAPNAVNSDLPAAETGLRVLQPGETLAGAIMLTASIDT